MAITPVSSSTAAVTATQALRPQQDVNEARQAQKTSNDDANNAAKVEQAAPPKPTINTNGQTVGTLVNVTA